MKEAAATKSAHEPINRLVEYDDGGENAAASLQQNA
jgi:hypothetical protein